MSSRKLNKTLTDKQKKTISIISFIAFLIFCGVVTYFIGKPLISFVSEPEKFQIWVDSHGIWSEFAFIAMMIFQVVIALVPGEPLEIGAGYAFGSVEGTILCLIGTMVGSVIVFLLVKRFGLKFVEIFFSSEKIKSVKFLQSEKKLNFITFIVFFFHS